LVTTPFAPPMAPPHLPASFAPPTPAPEAVAAPGVPEPEAPQLPAKKADPFADLDALEAEMSRLLGRDA
jgi:hypothetical protein